MLVVAVFEFIGGSSLLVRLLLVLNLFEQLPGVATFGTSTAIHTDDSELGKSLVGAVMNGETVRIVFYHATLKIVVLSIFFLGRCNNSAGAIVILRWRLARDISCLVVKHTTLLKVAYVSILDKVQVDMWLVVILGVSR